jgi:PP-loop superfamily ATP-utilizing enzyme
MADDRLSNLTLIAVERELCGKLMRDPAAVIDEFASCGSRRLELLL